MVRSSLPSLRMRDLLSRLLVVMVLVSVVVATDVVPGLRWDRLEIWENSASHDVWTRLSEYVEGRRPPGRGGYWAVTGRLLGGYWAVT